MAEPVEWCKRQQNALSVSGALCLLAWDYIHIMIALMPYHTGSHFGGVNIQLHHLTNVIWLGIQFVRIHMESFGRTGREGIIYFSAMNRLLQSI